MNEQQLSLAGKIAKASIQVGSFKADKKNTQQGYAYISADQVLSRAGDALAQQGIAILPSIAEYTVERVERQGKEPRLDARVTFSMTITDGTTEKVLPWYGFGSDYATPDKAVYKAITSGHKYFLMKILNIGEGNEDGEHENLKEPAARKQARPEAAVKMDYEQARQYKINTSKGERLIGELDVQHLNQVVLNSHDAKAVEAATVCLEHDGGLEPPAE